MANDGGVWTKIWPEAAPGAAKISGHNGATVETGKVIDGKTYDVYTFTDDTANDLSLTVETAGLIDLLVVGGGGGGGTDQGRINAGGGGGCVRWGMFRVDDGMTYPVTVGEGGAVGTYNQRVAGTSAFGEILKCGGGWGGEARYTTGGWNAQGHSGGGSGPGSQMGTTDIAMMGGGQGGTVYGTQQTDGLPIYITGEEQIYGRGGYSGMPAPVANRGDAGFAGTTGSAGIVIVRVEV